jgi:hypothetical protein
VLAAINATFDELPGPLSVPRHPLGRRALEREVQAVRVERIAIEGAIAALNAVLRPLQEQLMESDGPFDDRDQIRALQDERQRYQDRLAVVDAVMQDLMTTLRKQ